MNTADAATTRSRVQTALADLTAEDRAIISLAHFHKLTLREIADRTAIPVDAIQRRTTEALCSLKGALDDAALSD